MSGDFNLYLHDYKESMRVKGYSEKTVKVRDIQVGYFIHWCEERGISTVTEITKPIIERYQRWLYHYRKKNDRPLGLRAQQGRLISVKMYFKWLTRNNYLLYNPASEIELPKVEKKLPRNVLTVSEVEQIIRQVNMNEAYGLRDRAILETLYSTGIRRLELVNLQINDLDRNHGTVFVREGKGRKDRLIPIGERALKWVEKYIEEVRSDFIVGRDKGWLFLNRYGEPLKDTWLSGRMRFYVTQANIGKTGSCHLFRHTMATLMLENGADIRFIQAMLGHADLSTTDIYTQVSIKKLKEIHTATHPAKMKKLKDEGTCLRAPAPPLPR